ncbi:a852f046-4537-48dd-a39a-73e14910772c [Thermothielavioides terrestris]|uniref:A852f046-4537-48dd-a39a-73e14910772c n=1 Tax=Thermothielavioides terrestris TaxID=2587410 RepID=A0A446BFG6_9PEZI|nr:a852f046-4537-48dd-a39a-73e14910772c [Thermothielavioides terrestris]
MVVPAREPAQEEEAPKVQALA